MSPKEFTIFMKGFILSIRLGRFLSLLVTTNIVILLLTFLVAIAFSIKGYLLIKEFGI